MNNLMFIYCVISNYVIRIMASVNYMIDYTVLLTFDWVFSYFALDI